MSDVILSQIKLEKGWKTALSEEFKAPYFGEIKDTILSAKHSGKIIYPPAKLIFHAFDRTPFDKVKVVIIGQDPYHGPKQAMGLSFSVPEDIPVPPSLKNIYKELKAEYPDYKIPNHGNLSRWTDEGVLLLNASLTVEAGKAASHSQIGWQQFTDAAIKALNNQREHIVFMLWGNYAKSKAIFIDRSKHCVLKAVHPSPLARGGFFGCNHFLLANEYLATHDIAEIDWQI